MDNRAANDTGVRNRDRMALAGLAVQPAANAIHENSNGFAPM